MLFAACVLASGLLGIQSLLMFDSLTASGAAAVLSNMISKLNCSPASQTKWKLTHVASKVAEGLLLPSGMHTKKLERYRED